jgi:hypothetical protein
VADYGPLVGFWVLGTEHAFVSIGNIVDWMSDCKLFHCYCIFIFIYGEIVISYDTILV